MALLDAYGRLTLISTPAIRASARSVAKSAAADLVAAEEHADCGLITAHQLLHHVINQAFSASGLIPFGFSSDPCMGRRWRVTFK